jgi:hypothetical protein
VSLYLDASVVVPTLVQEDSSAAVLAFLAAASEQLLVSEYAAAEVASAVSRLVRMRDLTLDEGRESLEQFDVWRAADTLPIELENPDVVAAAALVRRFELKLRTPDALHLAVCVRAGARMVTLDFDLGEAAVAIGAELAALV